MANCEGCKKNGVKCSRITRAACAEVAAGDEIVEMVSGIDQGNGVRVSILEVAKFQGLKDTQPCYHILSRYQAESL